METRRLYKIEDGKKISGVCGGIAEYLNIDPSLVRILWVLFGLAYFTGVVVYVVAAMILPYKYEVM